MDLMDELGQDGPGQEQVDGSSINLATGRSAAAQVRGSEVPSFSGAAIRGPLRRAMEAMASVYDKGRRSSRSFSSSPFLFLLSPISPQSPLINPPNGGAALCQRRSGYQVDVAGWR